MGADTSTSSSASCCEGMGPLMMTMMCISFVVATNKTHIGLHRFSGRRQGRASGQHCMNAMPTVMLEISKLPVSLCSNIERCAHTSADDSYSIRPERCPSRSQNGGQEDPVVRALHVRDWLQLLQRPVPSVPIAVSLRRRRRRSCLQCLAASVPMTVTIRRRSHHHGNPVTDLLIICCQHICCRLQRYTVLPNSRVAVAVLPRRSRPGNPVTDRRTTCCCRLQQQPMPGLQH